MRERSGQIVSPAVENTRSLGVDELERINIRKRDLTTKDKSFVGSTTMQQDPQTYTSRSLVNCLANVSNFRSLIYEKIHGLMLAGYLHLS